MVKKKTDDHQGAWVYLLDQGEVGAQPSRVSISAGEAERRAVAQRLGLVSVEALSSDVTLTRTPGNKAVVYVEGILKADITQSCVATGAPVRNHIEDEFEAWFADPSSFTSFAKARRDKTGRGADDEIVVMEEREDPEPIVNGKIDLGDLATQYLSLGVDPYPRAHGAPQISNKESVPEPEASPLRKNPFEALKDWKKK
jgi:uncharacterized metal-binding protein YceD (DUF177 family)